MISFRTPGLINTHCHLRQDEEGYTGPSLVHDLIEHAVRGGAIALGIMPNPQAGVHAPHDGLHTAEDVAAYLKHMLETHGMMLTVLIKIVLITEKTTQADIDACIAAGIHDGKIYPLDRTTGSDKLGVRDYHLLIPIVRHCGKVGMRVHMHPEHPLMDIHSRDAEYEFIAIADMFMRATEDVQTVFVWEHGTDSRCISFWKKWGATGRFYVTLTAHHLASDEDELFGDVRGACKPPVKTRLDRSALCAFVLEGHSWVMAGLDDAPHDMAAKHPEDGRCVCGAYTAPFGLQLYAHALLSERPSKKEIEIFLDFTVHNAEELYGFRAGRNRFELIREPFEIPLYYTAGSWKIPSFWGGRTIKWSLELPAAA
ncbi:MAG: hypothetical protein WDZ79_01495 [Candidatus Paceibacterota bacterium]